MEQGSSWILVVEDDAEIRLSLGELLEEEGYRVVGASNGREALNRLEKAERPPCVILLDLMMPVMDGWQFRAAQKRAPTLRDIPVVVVTAAGDVASTIDADKFLAKPLRLEAVLEVAKKYCRST